MRRDNTALRFPEAPAFTEREDGTFEATSALYKATLSETGGLSYFPQGGSAKLNVRLEKITRGENALFDETEESRENTTTVNDAAGELSFWRSPVLEERYIPRGCGVEQSFLIETCPEGNGPLEIVCALKLDGLTPLPAVAARAGGISFADSKGKFAARYGQVVIRDSAHHGTVSEPRLGAGGKCICFDVAGEWLEKAVFPIVIDPLVGQDFLISPDAPQVSPPTVTPGNNSFLVAWNDFTVGPNQPVLLGSIVSQAGLPSLPFAISSPTAGLPRDYRFQRIESAFDGSNWLVVWSDDRQVGPGIRGSIISAAGQLLQGTDFLIAPTPTAVEEDPLVVFNGSDFVVAWQSLPPNAQTGSQVYYVRVSSTGVVTGAQTVPSPATPPSQILSFLSPQTPGGDVLLIYRETTDSPARTKSVRIAPDGTLRDPGGTALFTEKASDNGFGRAVGAVFTNSAWNILSSYDQNTDSKIFLHTLTPGGALTPPSGVFARMGLGPTTLTVGGGISIDSYAPAFAGNGEWLFIRNERVGTNVFHLLGKRVTFGGLDQDPIPFQIDTATQGIVRNAVAAQVGNNFLVAWLDGRKSSLVPGDSRSIAGALVDATVAGTAGTPLVATMSASPVSGEAPLSVNFDSTASTGSYDTLTWDFGDGTTSANPTIPHTYKSNGTYTAQLKLTKGAYTVLDSTIITVGSGSPSGGSSQQIGLPVENSPGMVAGLQVKIVRVKLDFVTPANNNADVEGVIDISQLPASLVGVGGSVTIGSDTQEFTLDAKGSFKTTAVNFTVNRKNGKFAFISIDPTLVTTMNLLGAPNDNANTFVNIPITVRIGAYSVTATVGAKYTATAQVSGAATFGFLTNGKIVSGVFGIDKFSANQTSLNGIGAHSYAIRGVLIRPQNGPLKLGATGSVIITVGKFVVTVPVGQVKESTRVIKFIGRGAVTGLKKFQLDKVTGKFILDMPKVAADGVGGSGLPLANSGGNIVSADLNLSIQMDLADGRFNAGRLIFIERKDASGRVWKLR